MNKNVLFILSITLLLLISAINCELRFAFNIFRHGARSPNYLNVNGTDMIGEQWSIRGELTEIGMRQHYLLGYRNKFRYKNFLSSTFDPNEIYIISTDYNRTMMSAQSHLQGLYPPGTGPQLNKLLIDQGYPPVHDTNFTDEVAKLDTAALPSSVQVFPIHLFDPKIKTPFVFKPPSCSKIGNVIKERQNVKAVTDFNNKFNATYGEQLLKSFNINDKDFFSVYENIHELSDSFVADFTEGRPLHKIIDAGISLQDFNKSAFEHLIIDTMDVYSGDLTAGIVVMSPTFIAIEKWMHERFSNDIKQIGYKTFTAPKLVMYSAHDRSLADFITYLQAVFELEKNNAHYPGYASSILVEFYSKDNITDFTNATEEDYYVTVTMNDFLILNLTYVQFKTNILTKSYNEEKIGEYCGWPDSPKPTPSPSPPVPPQEDKLNIFIVTTIIFAVIALLQFGFIFYQKRKFTKLSVGQPVNVSNYNAII